MTKSYTGGHPLQSVVADIVKERDAAITRAEAAERHVAELEASREHFQMLWVSDGCKYAQFADDLVAALKIELPDEYEDDEDGTLAVIVAKVAELEARLATTETQRDEYIALHDQDVIRIAQLVARLGMLGSRVDFERLYNGSWDDEGE